MTQTEIQGILNPYGIRNAWTWLARILNTEPCLITATLLVTFLTVIKILIFSFKKL